MSIDPTRRILVDLRQRMQKSRIQFSNRISAIDNGVDTADERTKDILHHYLEAFQILEKEATKDIHDLVVGDEMVDRLLEIKGIGKTLAAQLTSMIDIEEDDYVSDLWRYAGFAVGEDGKAERPKRGERLHYNSRLKTVLFNVAMSFLKSHSPYANIYYEAQKFYTINKPDWTLAHVNAAARRKMVKIFLQHYWLVERTIRGLPTNDPYIMGKGNHRHMLRPQQFGWSDFGEG